MPFLLTTFLLILAIQIGFFIFALALKTDKFTDLAYGSTFVVIAWIALVLNPPFTAHKFILTLLVTLWGARLATYLFYRILIIGRDRRFDQIREHPVKFGSFWLLQSISIFIISITFVSFLSLSSPQANPWLVTLGAIVNLTGLIIETIADWQKFIFKSDPNNQTNFIHTGLWRHARHPNYFGEILVWWGIYVFVASALTVPQALLSLTSPLYITGLLLFVSGIPPLEKRYAEKYQHNTAYQNYRTRTNLLAPLPFKLF